MSPTTGTRSSTTSSPIGRLIPGMTNRRSSTRSIASTRWRTDAGSVPTRGKGRRSSGWMAIVRRLTSGAHFLLQVGERVAREAVPGKAQNAPCDERPADRRGDRNEQLPVVDSGGGLGKERVTLP